MKKNKLNQIAIEEYNKNILYNENEKEKELKNIENNYLEDKNEIKKKYENEINKREIIYQENIKKTKEKYQIIKDNYNKEYKQKLLSIEELFNKKINDLNSLYKEKIENNEDLFTLNQIIYNAFNKCRNNYYYNINIFNILINYYNEGNQFLKDFNDKYFLEMVKIKKNEVHINPNIEKNIINEPKNNKENLNDKNIEEKNKFNNIDMDDNQNNNNDIKIKISKMINKINEFRNDYGLSKFEYTDEQLFNALKKNDFKYDYAFSSLYH